MKLTVWLPSEVLLEEEVSRIRAEADNGWFGLREKHVDFVSALVPGILTFQSRGRPEEYLAVDRGILVKCGRQVSVSTRNAVRGKSLEELRRDVEQQFREREEREKKALAYEAKLEADLVRRLLEVEKRG